MNQNPTKQSVMKQEESTLIDLFDRLAVLGKQARKRMSEDLNQDKEQRNSESNMKNLQLSTNTQNEE